MLISLFNLKHEAYKRYYKFLPTDCWIILVLGCILGCNTGFLAFGRMSAIQCKLKSVFLSISHTLIIMPLFYKLIANFTIKNKFSFWIRYHRYTFFSCYLAVNATMIGIFMLLASYRVEKRIVLFGKNYEACKINNEFGILLNFVLFFTNIFTTFTIMGLCFME